MPETIRTFIAIELPKEIQNKLGEFTDWLKNKNDKITWVTPKNIHLTLKFLGNMPINNTRQIQGIISDVAKFHQALHASIKGIGIFPNERSPRVLWVGVDKGKEDIKNIYRDLENKLSFIGIAKEEREFKTHLTLGRIKYINDIKGFIQLISKHKEDLFGNFVADSISLIKSALTQKGSVYEILYKIMLGKQQTA